ARARRLEHRRRDRVVGLQAVVEGEDDAGLAGEPVVRADSAAAESQGELELLTETRAVDAVVRIDVRAVRGAHRVIHQRHRRPRKRDALHRKAPYMSSTRYNRRGQGPDRRFHGRSLKTTPANLCGSNRPAVSAISSLVADP